jgi:hypothetical protein
VFDPRNLGKLEETMVQRLPDKAMTVHKHLASAYLSGALGAILLRLAAGAAKPGVLHVILGLIAIGAIVGAYLSVARSSADGSVMAANIVGIAVLAGVCFALVSLLV